jgi:hypothetical protein
VIIDFERYWGNRFMTRGVILPTDISFTASRGDYSRVSIEGYLSEGSYEMASTDRCHLCNAPLVKESHEREINYIDVDEVSFDVARGLNDRKTKEVLVQQYECGTIVAKESGKRANKVKVGANCIQFPKAE